MEIIIDCSIVKLNSEELLHQILNATDLTELHEILISGHGDTSLTVMTNPYGAFMMFLRENGDSGFTSRNQTKEEGEFVDFKLSNGQVDQYPLNWVIKHEEAKQAIISYYRTGNMLETINWFEE